MGPDEQLAILVVPSEQQQSYVATPFLPREKSYCSEGTTLFPKVLSLIPKVLTLVPKEQEGADQLAP